MAVKSLKEFQFPGSADSYTFDATLFDGKTPDLFALLGGNNEFAGKNVFSGITAIHDSEGDMTFGAKSFVLTSPEGDPIGESVLPSSDDGGQFFLAWANDESNADLSLYAKTSDLSSYVTNTSLTDTLKSYVTSSSLTSTLGSYVTKTSLTTTLGDYVTKTSLTSTLGGYAKLSANNAFTGTNSFSNAISVDTINSKATGNSIARMYYDADKAYKVLLGSVARQITLLGNTDRPYYAKDGEAFNAHSLALSEDLSGLIKPDSNGKLSFGGGKADSMLSIADAGSVDSAKYLLLATMQASDASSWSCVFVKGRIGGWGTNTIDVDVRIQGRDGPYITGTAHSINSWGMSAALEACDIIATVNADLTMSVWLKVSGYYSYALDVRCAADGSKVAYTGTQGLITGGTVKDRLSTSSYVMKVYGSSTAQTGDVDIPSGSIYKINGENMCNYRKLSASAKLDAGAQGSASVTAYGLYVNNVLVKIIGYYTAAVALDTGATGITFNIGWDRQQSSDFQSLGLSYLSSKESLRSVTTDTWHCEVWIDGANYGGTNIRFMLV